MCWKSVWSTESKLLQPKPRLLFTHFAYMYHCGSGQNLSNLDKAPCPCFWWSDWNVKWGPFYTGCDETVKFLYCLFQIMASRFDSVVNSIVIQKYIGSLATCLKFCMTWITFMEVYVTEELNRPSPLQRSCKHFCISDILDQFDPFLIYPMEPGPHINTISLYCSLK